MKKLHALLLATLIPAAAIGGWNYLTLHSHVASAIEEDPRNEGIRAYAYHQFLVDPGTVVFDLHDISGEKSRLDVTRVLLQFAERIQDQRFDRAILAFQGSPRFVLEGTYFQELGAEYQTQNPAYTLRTMPQNTYNLDGTAAFSTWEGGLLGVLGRQMEDFGELHDRWYLTELMEGKH